MRDYGFETSVLRHNWASAVAGRYVADCWVQISKRKQGKLHEILIFKKPEKIYPHFQNAELVLGEEGFAEYSVSK